MADQEQSPVVGVHLVVGGFPPGSGAGHDMDHVRLQLLQKLADRTDVTTSVANDFADLETWLGISRFLITYTAGPHPDDAENEALRAWLEGGGRWLGLHGTSGGRAARAGRRRQMIRTSHHDTPRWLLPQPPADPSLRGGDRRPRADRRGRPVHDERRALLRRAHPPRRHHRAPHDGAGHESRARFWGSATTPTLRCSPTGRTRAIGFTRPVGAGGCRVLTRSGTVTIPARTASRGVDASVVADGTTPPTFRGSWDTEGFDRLLDNAIAWGCAAASGGG